MKNPIDNYSIFEKINSDNYCYIIAEIGVNHNGDLNTCKSLIDAAKTSGADAVKIQTYKTHKLVIESADKSNYQKDVETEKESLFSMLQKYELTKDDHYELMHYANTKNIQFLSTAFDYESVDLLDEIGVPIFKISSGDLTTIPLIKYIASKGKPIILSTGRSNMTDISEAVEAIKSITNIEIALLHCVSSYPAPQEDLNLKAIQTLKNSFMVPVGYSDHSLGSTAAIVAVTLGAKIVEKHITLDSSSDGPDHKASMEPEDFKRMVLKIRSIGDMLGSGIKKPTLMEAKEIQKGRKGVYASKNITKGSKFDESMFELLRPANSISPNQLETLFGKIAAKDITAMEGIEWDMVKD